MKKKKQEIIYFVKTLETAYTTVHAIVLHVVNLTVKPRLYARRREFAVAKGLTELISYTQRNELKV